MKCVTIEIKDNSARICETDKQYLELMRRHDLMQDEINQLQTEALLKMLTYIFCAYQDYVKINEITMEISICGVALYIMPERINIRLGGGCIRESLICANITPNGAIEIVERSQDGIALLMREWPKVKKALQAAIDAAIKAKIEAAHKQAETDESLLKIARDFQL